ncbi:LysR family transcriptional regulator [Ottowia thiooxydans]|uniref:DNA-binding transcriptional LysR family regulator n=1 Tax=Ottowia thiooxydans TaxID=219182 RepID=A0ABV2Q6H5_9BURK
MHIDFLGIQAFLAIVENGSFQLAAVELNLSQTAVSHRMRKLEEFLGVRLIARTTRDVTLTDAGRALLPDARRAVRELGMSCEAVRQHGQHAPDWLAFACLPTLCTNLVSPLLTEASQTWPDTFVRVFDTATREIVELVESKVAAFGISVMHQGYGNLSVEVIAEEPFVLICPLGHRFASLGSVDCSALEHETMIRISLTTGNSTTIDGALGRAREHLHWRYEALHNSVAVDMVRAGLGLTIVPRLSLRPEPGVAIVRLNSPRIQRTLCAVNRRDDSTNERERWLQARAVDFLKTRLADG